MSVPRKYRALIMVVGLACLLGLADNAFSYRLTNFATTVVGDLISEVAELTAPAAPSRQTAIAPARPAWDTLAFQFPPAAEFPAAFSAFGYRDQPWISLGTPLVLDSTRGGERPGPRSTAAFQNPSASQRSMARQSMAGSGGSGSGATSSEAVSRLMSSAVAAIQDPQAEAAGSATSADLATAAIDSPETSLAATSLEATLWSELKSSGTSGGAGGTGGSGEPSRDGAFGDTASGAVSHRDLIAAGSLSEALALDSANGGPGLDVPTVLAVSAVLDVPGTAPSDLGLDWLRQLRSEDAQDLSPAALAEESASPENAVAVLPEPAVMAVFGVGLLALAGRLRSRFRRPR